jgi:hypothetical protein
MRPCLDDPEFRYDPDTDDQNMARSMAADVLQTAPPCEPYMHPVIVSAQGGDKGSEGATVPYSGESK